MQSADSLRAMMQMAAATASAVATTPPYSLVANSPAPRSYRPHTTPSTRGSTQSRRQSINQLGQIMDAEPLPKGAPLPSPVDGHRWSRLAAVAAEIAQKWAHPPGSGQYETDVLHQVRAILYMNKTLITQSFVSHVSGVSQGSLSHYVRGLFRGNQRNIEERLGSFVQKFTSGELDKFLEEARSGSRPLRTIIYEGIAAPSANPEKSSQLPHIPRQDFRPPVPPPPPPQLQPAPWTRPSPAKPPLPLQPALQPALQPSPVAAGSHAQHAQHAAHMAHQVISERARRAKQRHIAAMAKKRRRTRTPFIAWLEDMRDPSSVDAVERAFHALVAPNWVGDYTHSEPLLLPILLYVEIGGKVLHMYTQWDVNERVLSPEVVAERIRRARGLRREFAGPAAMQIRMALFEAGIISAPPPSVKEGEERRLIRIEVGLEGKRVLRDEFEWDLGMGAENSPELFAQYLCTDLNVNQKFAAAVARAIREKLVFAHAIAFGDDDTRKMALAGLKNDDPLRKALPKVRSAILIGTEGGLSRNLMEMEIMDWVVNPLLEDVAKEGERRAAEREEREKEEARRLEIEEIRKKFEEEVREKKDMMERALAEVDAAAEKLQKQRGLDFKPYLALRLGRGERPSVWTPGIFDRKRRRQTSFPMLQPTKLSKSTVQQTSRSGRRKRPRRVDDALPITRSKTPEPGRERRETPRNSRVQAKRGTDYDQLEMRTQVTETVINGNNVKVRLLLRLRPEDRKESSKSGGSSSKKRRRR